MECKKSIYHPIENFKQLKLSSWGQIIKIFNNRNKDINKDKKWIYRGQSNSTWFLSTNYERSLIRYYYNEKTIDKIINDKKNVDLKRILEDKKYKDYIDSIRRYIFLSSLLKNKKPLELEEQIIREFKRKTSNYIKNVPEDELHIQWLSLMQHYGAPTRLLDFTYSFFVALYNAIEEAEKECVVYAIDTLLFKESLNRVYNKSDYIKIEETKKENEKFINELFYREFPKLITYNISPYNYNERITVQQGTFLCQKNIKYTFLENLEKNIELCKSGNNKIIKYIIDLTKNVNLKREIISNLHRMNISRISLYPGLEGFAKSLGIRMEVNEQQITSK